MLKVFYNASGYLGTDSYEAENGTCRARPKREPAPRRDDEQGRRDADFGEQWRYIGRKRLVSFSWVAAMKCDLRLQRSPFILDFWGKASPTNQAGISTHSIVYHSLDVAAVGAELIGAIGGA